MHLKYSSYRERQHKNTQMTFRNQQISDLDLTTIQKKK